MAGQLLWLAEQKGVAKIKAVSELRARREWGGGR